MKISANIERAVTSSVEEEVEKMVWASTGRGTVMTFHRPQHHNTREWILATHGSDQTPCRQALEKVNGDPVKLDWECYKPR